MERASLSVNQASVSSGNSVSAPSVSEEVRGPEKEAPSPAGEKSDPEEARSSSALEEPAPEETTAYEAQVLVELKVTNELLVLQAGLLVFVAGFLVFLFVHRLLSRMVTNLF
ncbi:MAG: hypothetical protein K1W28_15415 [Lachnospiraceae bacterium]